jgi:hypothetical protein
MIPNNHEKNRYDDVRPDPSYVFVSYEFQSDEDRAQWYTSQRDFIDAQSRYARRCVLDDTVAYQLGKIAGMLRDYYGPEATRLIYLHCGVKLFSKYPETWKVFTREQCSLPSVDDLVRAVQKKFPDDSLMEWKKRIKEPIRICTNDLRFVFSSLRRRLNAKLKDRSDVDLIAEAFLTFVETAFKPHTNVVPLRFKS